MVRGMGRIWWLLAAVVGLVGCSEDTVDQALAASQATRWQSFRDRAAPDPSPQSGAAVGSVRGRVVDDLADPVVGARVLLAPALGLARLVPGSEPAPLRTTTDSHGRFGLDPAPAWPKASLLLAVRHSYFKPWFGHLNPDDSDLGDLALEPAPGLVVEVRGEQTLQPLPGARVQLRPALEDATLPAGILAMFCREGVTAANGHAPLYAVAQGTYVLRVEATDRATAELRHQQPATVARALRIAVQLPKGQSLRGRVVSAAGGKPLQGAQIICVPEAGHLSHTVNSDARGEFTLSGLRPQRYRLTATHEEHAPLVATAVPGDGPHTLELPVGQAIEGQVLYGITRQPVPGARVMLRLLSGWPVLRQGSLQQPTAVTNGRGQFRVGGLPGGIVSVAAESEGLFAMEQGPIQPGSGAITLLLQDGSRVTGKCQDPAGQPLRDALVEVLPTQQPGLANRRLLARVAAGGRPLPATTTGSSGRFDLGGLPPGHYRLLVQKQGLPPFLSQAFVAGPRGREDLGTLRLPAGGRVRGVATDRRGQPVAGARVCLDPLSGLPPEAGGAQAVCDAQGRFALGPVAPGQYQMFYYSPDKQTAAEAAASRHSTLVQLQVLNHQDLIRNLHPRSR